MKSERHEVSERVKADAAVARLVWVLFATDSTVSSEIGASGQFSHSHR
jgi:hypothetical protein